jgi:hypothetical protein
LRTTAVALNTLVDEPFVRRFLRRLMIECPHTGHAVDTGYELTAIPGLAIPHMLIDCIECGQDHTWRVEDAFVERC